MPSNYEPKTISIKTYIKEKLRMLQNDFYINLTEEEIAHMKSLKREIDVDHYAYDIINKNL